MCIYHINICICNTSKKATTTNNSDNNDNDENKAWKLELNIFTIFYVNATKKVSKRKKAHTTKKYI